MVRCLVGMIAVAVVAAVRREFARTNALGDEAKVPEVMDRLFSMVEKHVGLPVSPSLQEMALTAVWTNGTAGILSGVVSQIQQDVLKRIELGHVETQQLIEAAARRVTTKAANVASSKHAVDVEDEALQICIEQEKEVLQVIVTSQDLYNVKTDQTVEPCTREQNTSKLTAGSGGLITADCDTDTDPLCRQAMAELAQELDALKREISDKFSSLATMHKTAEGDCRKAVEAQSAQFLAVTGHQAEYHQKRGDCAGNEMQRDMKICIFGVKLQDVCDAKTVYDNLVEDTRNHGNEHSVQDRISEYEVTQLVVCLLDDFAKGVDLTDQSVEKCQAKTSTSQFDLNLMADVVQSSLDAASSPTFKIGCQDGEAIVFHGGVWNRPNVTSKIVGYTAYEVSVENQTLPVYRFDDDWSLPVSLDAATPAFALHECANQDSLEEMIDPENVSMTMQEGTNWSITASIVTTEASATIAARAFQHGLWRKGTSGGEGKLLFLRHGMLTFDVGWVGFMQGSTRVDDGKEHAVGVEWSTDGLQLIVDGKRETLRHHGLRNRFVKDDPETEFIVGISVGHRITDGEANGDMSKKMLGTIQMVTFNGKQVRNSSFPPMPKKIR